MTNHELDARAARAMGWTVEQWHERESWCPTVDANHLEEMLREIHRRSAQRQYVSTVLRQVLGDYWEGYPALNGGLALDAAPLKTRVLAACGALEGTREAAEAARSKASRPTTAEIVVMPSAPERTPTPMPKSLEDMTEPELKAQMQLVAEANALALPPGTGFIVLAATFEPSGIAQYVSNVDRDDAIFWMLETIQRWLKKDYIPRVGQ